MGFGCRTLPWLSNHQTLQKYEIVSKEAWTAYRLNHSQNDSTRSSPMLLYRGSMDCNRCRAMLCKVKPLRVAFFFFQKLLTNGSALTARHKKKKKINHLCRTPLKLSDAILEQMLEMTIFFSQTPLIWHKIENSLVP